MFVIPDQVADAFITFAALLKHPGKHGNSAIDVVIDTHFRLCRMKAVQPADVLLECSAPRNRQREKERIQSRIIETFANVSTGGDNNSIRAACHGRDLVG